MDTPHAKIALFIDADNAPAGKIDFILSELASYGTVNIRKAYGNWKSRSLKGWEAALHENAIQPVQQFDLTKGKNATDIAIVIDAMDVLYTKQVDVFCIVSSDCDFAPLATRLRAEGRSVLGYGERKTPAAFTNACSKFLYLEDQAETEENAGAKGAAARTNLKRDTKLIGLLRNAIESCEDEDGWANLGQVGSHIANQTSFDQRNYGYKKLSDLFGAIDLFEIVRGTDKRYRVRDKKKTRQVQR